MHFLKIESIVLRKAPMPKQVCVLVELLNDFSFLWAILEAHLGQELCGGFSCSLAEWLRGRAYNLHGLKNQEVIL